MMYPVCVRLPAETALASALWSVLETGSSLHSGLRGHRAFAGAHRQHLDTLLHLLRGKLTGEGRGGNSVWMERRELGDLLVVLDEGLRTLARQPLAHEVNIRHQEAVMEFLREIRRQLPAPRKPASRQTPGTEPAEVMVAAASGD
ncbi:MAG: hypothetical protein KIT83_15185 [Bryobacterales bacterium]|nr:hypothetical protein [Bryobacterales bacterium]